MPAIGPYRWHRTPTPEPPSSYNPNDFLANMQGEANIIERFPTYGLSRTKLLEFMGTLFAENEYEISIHNDYYHIILPRKLSEAEAQALADLPDYLRGPRKKPEVTVSRDLSTTKKEATLAQDLGVPLIIPSDQGKLVIPVSYPKIHSSYEIVTSHVDLGSVHSSGYLYGARISYGITCEVYETTARWLWIGSEAVDNQTGHTFKLAVKRLSGGTTLEQLMREYNALSTIKKRYHPNIVELLSAFRYGDEEVHYNLSFPLAVGNLKQLFRGSLEDKAGISIAVASLWSQFEGLANGLAYLHDECKIVHADLKSSNNLLYETSGSPPLVAKIADFGLAATLSNTATWTIGTVEAISAWKYDPPELRAHMAKAKLHSGDESRNEEIPSAEQLKRADIWKLGAVFIELSTFLVYGVSGIADFRHYITTKRKNITSDELSDTRFDDGVEVKTEVLDWIRRLSQCDPFVSEIEGILSQMLAKDVDRPSAAQVSSRLRETSSCVFFDGERQVSVMRPGSVPKLSWIDEAKEKFETQLGGPIDWWPLRNGQRRCPSNHSRILWEYADHKLYVDVPDEAIREYLSDCVPISHAPPPAVLPLHTLANPARNPRQIPGQYNRYTAQVPYQPRSMLPAPGRGADTTISNITPLFSSNVAVPTLTKEIYWCVDKAWSEPKETRLCSLQIEQQPTIDGQAVRYIADDSILCQCLLDEYRRVRTWKGRIFSWKRCLGVEFINFSSLPSNKSRILKIAVGLPPIPGNYVYNLRKPEQVHMALAAEQLILGIYAPQKLSGVTTTLSMIPKYQCVPLRPETDSDGWGIHALQRFSLMKILWWILGLTITGIVFVVFWLVFVDKTDLQNAFVPFTFLAGMVMIGLAVPQLLDVD